MNPMARDLLKRLLRALATLAVTPALISFGIRAWLIGADRALEGSSQAFALLPGILGQYLRRAFLSQTLAHCAPSATVECGTLFSSTGARLDEGVYVGPHCHLGLVHLQAYVLLGPAVVIPSGPHTHGTADPSRPISAQAGDRTLITIGAGTWVGAAAVVMADVGSHSVVGAGAVVTRPLPSGVIAAGVPARVVRLRSEVAPPAASA